MDITIIPGKLSGTIAAISSKSHLHRVLICAALADHDTEIYCSSVSNDIEATISCLRALNSKIIRTETGYHVVPIQSPPQTAILNCGESGTTLRFMLPIVGALGISGTFLLSGRLTERPLLPLWEQMEKHGCSIQKTANDTLLCSGQLHAGTFYFPGNISSQFISGVLLAMPLLNGSSKINIEGILQSEPYVNMTLSVMEQFGIKISDYEIPTAQPYISPGRYTIEGDWSNSAFFIAANAIGNQIQVTGLLHDSVQGDKSISTIINYMYTGASISVQNIPDLVPPLSIVAAAGTGARFTEISRLRLKESDRIQSITHMLNSLGISTTVMDDSLCVHPGHFHGGIVNSHKDHRIAMAAAIAATVSHNPVTILNAECVDKSYPTFWSDFTKLGGKYEQYIRP